jgi:phosphatidate phosphatase APP1
MPYKTHLIFVFSAMLSLTSVAHAASSRSFRIVSDYDDTLKIAHVSGPKWDVVRRSLFSESFYAGMSTLFGVWDQTTSLDESPLHILSASPKQLSRRIKSDLKEKGFPEAELSLRDWNRERDSVAYKLSVLRRHLEHDDSLLLIGDDTEHDSEIYAAFAREKRILATYIRRVTGAPLAKGQKSFLTAYDIAAFEYAAGRLQSKDALTVADSVLRSPNKLLKPRFVTCTALRSSCLDLRLPGPLESACQAIQSRLASLCSNSKN